MINKQQPNIHNGSMTFDDYMQFVFEDTSYSYVIMDTFYAQRFENLGNDNRLSLLQKGLERYKAEMEIVGTQVRFKSKIGNDTDFQFRYGHNIKTIQKNIDTTNLATVIRGFGAEGIEAYYRSPNADIFGELDAPSVKDERYTSQETLLEEIKSRLQDTPELSITINFVDLRAAGYPWTVPNEGDRVFVIYEPMDDLLLETRIMEIVEIYNANLKPIKTQVTLSTQRKTFAGTMFDNVQKQLSNIVNDDGVVKYSVLDKAVRLATEALQSAQTELEFVNGIIARDKEDPNLLVLLNSRGLGVSSDGGQTFPEAITGHGINATLITVGTMLFDRIKGGTLTLGGEDNGNGKMTVLNEDGEVIADLDAERGGFDRLYVGLLESPSVVNVNTQNYAMYVDPVDGLDTNNGLSWAAPKKTVQNCLDSIPKYNTARVTVYLHYEKARNLYENISISGFAGQGTITIDGQTTANKIIGNIRVNGNQNYVAINNLSLDIGESENIGFGVYRTAYCRLGSVIVNGTSLQEGVAFRADDGSNLYLHKCQAYNVNNACWAMTMSTIYVYDCSGLAGHIGNAAQYGGELRFYGNSMFAGADYHVYTDTGANSIGNGTPDYGSAKPEDPPPAPAPVQRTVFIDSVGGNNWSANGYWSNDGVKQGNYGWGNRKGVWFFGTKILDTIGTGKTIKSIKLYVKRASRGGVSASQRLSVRAHGYTSQPARDPMLSGEIGSISLAWGQSGWVTISSSAYANFANGTYKGFGLYTDNGSNYAICDTWSQAQITYE